MDQSRSGFQGPACDPEATVDLSAAPERMGSGVEQRPERVGAYRITARLGEGGMGMVYRATDERDGRPVALKLLRRELAADQDFVRRFQREAGIAAGIRDPHVMRVYAAGTADGWHYIACELIGGGDLGALLARRGMLTEHKALGLVIAATRGLAALHAAGLVHRDLKPDNIFFDAEGRVVLGDLGLARHQSGDDRFTMTGAAIGTPAYMSPEHIRGVADLDIRSDIYAMGAVLYKLFTGEEPYAGETLYLVTHKVLTEPLPDPRSINGAVPAEVAAIIRKAMAKQREERYHDPAQMLEDLERVRAGGRPAHAAGTVRRVNRASDAIAVVASDRGRHRGRRSVGASPGTMRAVGLVIAAALVIGGLHLAMTAGLHSAGSAVPAPAWATSHGRDAHGPYATISVAGVEQRLRYCPPGAGMLGSPPGEPGRHADEMQQRFTLATGFWIAETECTNAFFHAVTGERPSAFAGPQLPVEQVELAEARAFLEAVSRELDGASARLPTAAQWEYACRAGTDGPYAVEPPSAGGWFAPPGLATAWEPALRDGDPAADPPAVAAWHQEHRGDPRLGTRPVAEKRPNPWGIHDMHGNVAEWCALPDADPEAPHPACGGSWYDHPLRCRSAARLLVDPHTAHPSIGFRFIVVDDVAD